MKLDKHFFTCFHYSPLKFLSTLKKMSKILSKLCLLVSLSFLCGHGLNAQLKMATPSTIGAINNPSDYSNITQAESKTALSTTDNQSNRGENSKENLNGSLVASSQLQSKVFSGPIKTIAEPQVYGIIGAALLLGVVIRRRLHLKAH